MLSLPVKVLHLCWTLLTTLHYTVVWLCYGLMSKYLSGGQGHLYAPYFEFSERFVCLSFINSKFS